MRVAVVVLGLFYYVGLLGEFWGGADTASHYLIARWADQHPFLFLDHWGKPVYTLFLFPFAQLGFTATLAAQVALVGVNAWLAARLVARFGGSPWAAAVFVLAIPIAHHGAFGLTPETLFATVLLGAVTLMVYERPVAGALVASLLPFIRNEALVLLPVLAFMLWRRGQWRAIPLLFVALVASAFWFVTRFPYGDATQIYGRGPLWHYLWLAPGMFGLAMCGLFLWALRRRDLWMLAALPLVYGAAHAVSWWSGIGASLGFTRYFAAVAPLVAVVAAANLPARWVRWAVLVVAAEFVLREPPLPDAGPAHASLMDAVQVVEDAQPSGRVVFYDPHVARVMDLDPWNPEQACWALEQTCVMEPGDVLVWDVHFHENDAWLRGRQVNRIGDLLFVARPGPAVRALGGTPYRVEVWWLREGT